MLCFHVMRKEIAVDNAPANITFHVHGAPFVIVVLVSIVAQPSLKNLSTGLTLNVELLGLG